MSTIFAIMSGNASRGISSCGLCQRTDAAISKIGAAPRARTRPLSSLDVGREKGYLRCEGVLRAACGWDARTTGWERRPPRGLLENNPLAAPSRPARHDTRRRKGEAKHDTAKDSGGRAHRRDRGGGIRRLHVPAEGDEFERRRERAEHGHREPRNGDRHHAEYPADASRESEPGAQA